MVVGPLSFTLHDVSWRLVDQNTEGLLSLCLSDFVFLWLYKVVYELCVFSNLCLQTVLQLPVSYVPFCVSRLICWINSQTQDY